MMNLNLPPFEYKLKKAEGKLWIFDIIRKKYIILFPEEWVRQHFLHYLVNVLGYPKTLIKIEGGLNFNSLYKRSDLVVYDRDGNPWMLIECKAPDVKLSQNTIHQAAVYNRTLMARYLVVTNGLSHLYYEVNWTENTTIQLYAMPVYQ